MKLLPALSRVAAVATVAALAMPAWAGDACNAADLYGAGFTVVDCAGYYLGAVPGTEAQTVVNGEFAGISIGADFIEQVRSDSSRISFSTALHGDTVVGVRWGDGLGSTTTSFYRLAIGEGFQNLFVSGRNPYGPGGLQTVTLYATQAPVPAPASAALMSLGLAVVGEIGRAHV